MLGSSGHQTGPQSFLSRTVVHYTALAGRVKHTDIQYETGGGRGERKMGGEGKEGREGWEERGMS